MIVKLAYEYILLLQIMEDYIFELEKHYQYKLKIEN